MKMRYEEKLVMAEKWEVYKEQVRMGLTPDPSIHELLDEIQSKRRRKKRILNMYSKEFSEDFARRNDLTDHKINAIKALDRNGKTAKDIAEIIGINPFTVVYVLTNDQKEAAWNES